MNSNDAGHLGGLERGVVASGIPGLDTILEGGFLSGGIYIIQGHPGTGKTILGNQISFSHAEAGRKVLYVTLLAENHSRMLMHMSSLRFFKAAAIPEKIYYISAFTELEQNGLAGLISLLRREASAHGAQILVLDGLVAVASHAGTDLAFKKFIHELQLQASMLDCAMFLLTSGGTPHISAEHTMVDGVIELTYRLHGWRTERDVRVLKRRGADFIAGLHAFRITDAGITVYPRIEALPLEDEDRRVSGPSISSGIPQLDHMMGGGIPPCSTTLVLGSAGIGKTTLGLQFLSQCGPQEPGLFFGFYETPSAVRAKARALQLEVSALIDANSVEVLWSPATEGSIDEACARMMLAIRRGGVRRLFIDGLEALQKLATDPARISHILSALATQLQRLGVTTLYTAEIESLVGVQGPLSGLAVKGASSTAENIVTMRFIGIGALVYRAIAIIKVRDARIDGHVRLFEIDRGLLIDASHERAEAVLCRFPSRLDSADPSRNTGKGSDLQGG